MSDHEEKGERGILFLSSPGNAIQRDKRPNASDEVRVTTAQKADSSNCDKFPEYQGYGLELPNLGRTTIIECKQNGEYQTWVIMGSE